MPSSYLFFAFKKFSSMLCLKALMLVADFSSDGRLFIVLVLVLMSNRGAGHLIALCV